MLTILRDKFWRSVRQDENNLKKKKKKKWKNAKTSLIFKGITIEREICPTVTNCLYNKHLQL